MIYIFEFRYDGDAVVWARESKQEAMNDNEAIKALDNGSLWIGAGGSNAHRKLKDVLVSTGITQW